ncbi:MAG: aminoacyl-tRNA hydrolase [Acidobacteria bacterium]|nr:MAG: aminoacyl-tRNA hydrolase [Acidobacteriota bacterium]
MYLVVGLGNPGDEYAETPHNMGFRVVDLLAERNSIRASRNDSKALVGVGEIAQKPVMLAKPQTFMNLSGTSVAPLMEKHGLTAADLILIYDELDLPWGEMRIKLRGSAAGHHGPESVIEKLGTKEFIRVRLGVNPGYKIRDGAEYLLAPIKRSQRKEADELAARGAEAVESIIAEGVEKAMTTYNRRAQGSKPEEE